MFLPKRKADPPPAAGKTTLTEQLWAQLDRASYVVARVVTTQVSGPKRSGNSRATAGTCH